MKYIDVKLYNSNKLINNYEMLPCIIKDDRILFTLDNIKTTISNETFEREDDNYHFILNHKDRTCIYKLKAINQTYDIEVERLTINRTKEIIELQYKINSNDEEIKILINIKE